MHIELTEREGVGQPRGGADVPEPIPGPEVPSVLRLPDWPLPPRRYLPGVGPHPLREGRDEAEILACERASTEHRVLRGLDLYDRRFYWEAHEVWERAWRDTDDPSLRRLTQGLILACASVIRRHAGAERAADRLLQRTRERFEDEPTVRTAATFGIVLDGVLTALTRYHEGGPWPDTGGGDERR